MFCRHLLLTTITSTTTSLCLLRTESTSCSWFGPKSIPPGCSWKNHCKHTCPRPEGVAAFLSKWSSQRPFQQDHVASTTKITLFPQMSKRKRVTIIPGNTCSAWLSYVKKAAWERLLIKRIITITKFLPSLSRNKHKVWQCGDIIPLSSNINQV